MNTDDTKHGRTVTAIGNGCYFGDVALFYDVKRTATAVANTTSMLFALTKQDLTRCNDFHDQLDYMKTIAKYRLLRIKHIRESGRAWSALDAAKYMAAKTSSKSNSAVSGADSAEGDDGGTNADEEEFLS